MKESDVDAQSSPNIIYATSKSTFSSENQFIGTWFVIKLNGNFQTTALRGFLWNPEVRIYDTIGSGIFYEFDDQNRFFDSRNGVSGIWDFENDILITKVILPLHDGNNAIGFKEIIKFYNVEIIDEYYAVFQYEDTMTGKEMTELVVRKQDGLLEFIQNSEFSNIVAFFEIPENNHLLYRKFENNVTLLMYALSVKRADIALFLIERGVDINSKNVFNMTALHYACHSEKAEYFIDVIKRLLTSGAYINSADILGQTPLDYTLYGQSAFNAPLKEIRLFLLSRGGHFGNDVRELYAISETELLKN